MFYSRLIRCDDPVILSFGAQMYSRFSDGSLQFIINLNVNNIIPFGRVSLMETETSVKSPATLQ